MRFRVFLFLLLFAASVNAQLLLMISNDADRELYLDRQSIRPVNNSQVVFTLRSVFKEGRRPIGATETIGIAETSYTIDCGRQAIQEAQTQYVSDEAKTVGYAPSSIHGWSTIRHGSDFDAIRKKLC
ncbi:surface-adhesin E family protein [Burkholderia stagnalis]